MIALQGHHMDTIRLKEIGEHFSDALACLHDWTYWRPSVITFNTRPLRLLQRTNCVVVEHL